MATDLAATLAGIREDITRFQAAEAALVPLVENGNAPTRTPVPSPPAQSSGESTKPRRRPGRPAGHSGNRADQAFDLVQANPGITIPDLSKRMKIQPNYLYRVMPKLMSEGRVTRDENNGWHPAS